MSSFRNTPSRPSTPRRGRRPRSVWFGAGLVIASSIVAIPIVAAAAPDPSGGATPTASTVPVDTTVPVTTTTTTTTTTTVPVATAPPPIERPTTIPEPTAPETTVAQPPAAAPPVGPTALDVKVYPEQMEHILATIRYLESRGGYTLPPNRGNASGAYQFIASTWRNYGGYAHAYLAPPHIQDERAAKDVQMFLDRYDQDVSMVPIMWYYPKAANVPALMDQVPVPQAGNVLTVREYQTRWLGIFSFISGHPVAPRLGPVDLSAFAGFAPELPEPHEGVPSLSFPVLGPSRVAVPECDNTADVTVSDLESDGPSRADIEAAGLCAEQAPGIVFGVKLQPVLAVADGVVTNVRDEPGEPISLTVTDVTGMSYVYTGFNDDNPGTDDGKAPAHLRLSSAAEVGSVVRAGQLLGFMGDTDPLPVGVRSDVPTDATVQLDADAVAPHIRVTMIDIDGEPVEAFGPMIDALWRQSCRVMIGQWSSRPNGSDHDEVTIETTDDDNAIDSEWVVTSTGQVLASGWGALVNPSEGCGYAPDGAFGPGAGGSAQGLVHWFTPIKLPSDIWVSLAVQDEDTAPGLVRR